MKLDIVRFNDGPGGITALYVNGVLKHHFPHNDAYVEGWVDGVQYTGQWVNDEEHIVPADDCRSAWELGMVPKRWPSCSLGRDCASS